MGKIKKEKKPKSATGLFEDSQEDELRRSNKVKNLKKPEFDYSKDRKDQSILDNPL